MRAKLGGKFLQCVCLAVLAALIVMVLPSGKTFNYRYTIGTPWIYDLLDAEYNFPIRKSEAQVRAERDSVLSDFRPYLLKDTTVTRQVIESLQADAGEIGLTAEQAGALISELEAIYAQGVMDNELYLALCDSGLQKALLVEGVSGRSVDVADFYTLRTAYSRISGQVSLQSEQAQQLEDYVVPNIVVDEARTREARAELLAGVSYMNGMVQKGEKIIDRGEIVTEQKAQIIESYRYEILRQSPTAGRSWWRLAGEGIFIYCLLLVFLFSLYRYHPEYLKSWRLMLQVFLLMAVFPVIGTLVEQYTTLSALIVPFAMVPVFVRIFLDSRTAYLSLCVTILIAALGCSEPFVLIAVEFVAGMVGVYTIVELTSRSQILRCTLYVTLAAWLMMLAYDLSNGSVPALSYSMTSHTLGTLAMKPYLLLLLSGVLLLFAYPLMYLLERLSGFTSSVTLIEISNINTPLLRRLSKEAQGTFNHSMQVANLVTAVADRIGANVELVRTGALYHDIGKLQNPAFFTENQMGRNPHTSLPEEKSAQIIINHVRDGLDLAQKHNLPKVIREFIATHHGRSKTKYFYVQYVNKHQGEPVNEEIFTYPGPNPQTREQAILMMADSVEAASRSLREVNDETLRSLVNRLIDEQMEAGYFRRCPLTFRDVEEAKDELVQSLRTMYHTRVEYPELKKPQPEQEAEQPNDNSLFNLNRWYKPRKK